MLEYGDKGNSNTISNKSAQSTSKPAEDTESSCGEDTNVLLNEVIQITIAWHKFVYMHANCNVVSSILVIYLFVVAIVVVKMCEFFVLIHFVAD